VQGERKLGRAAAGDAGPQPSLKEAEGDQGGIVFALSAYHRVEIAVPTGGVGGLAEVEDAMVGGSGVGLPPHHSIADAPLVEELLEQEPDIEAHRFIADEKQGSAWFEDAMQVIQRGCDPVQVGVHPTLPTIVRGARFSAIRPAALVDPAGEEGRVQVDEIDAFGREAAKQPKIVFAVKYAGSEVVRVHDRGIRPLRRSPVTLNE
jgi:hypothetical protein